MLTLLFQLLICLIIADFITGLGHWVEDTYGVLSWPWPLRDGVVVPNIDHHRNPTFIATMSTLITRNYATVIPAVIIGAVFMFFGFWQVAAILLLSSLGNEVHSWSHRRENKGIVKFLQDAAIIQTPQQHARHHKQPYDKYYCTLLNITNAFLELISFWRGLEWVLRKVFGLEVKRMSPERDGF